MGEISERSFAVVKDYLLQNFPEFQSVRLKVCPEADRYYEESIKEQAGEGKLPRVFAHTLHEDNTVCYTEKMDTELSEEQRMGIFIHEFGHLYIENHPFDFMDEERPGEVENDDINADIVVYEMFRVEMHYDDNDIEYVNLPLGCDTIESLDDDEDDEKSVGGIEGDGEENGEKNGDIINHPDNISELLTKTFPKKEPDLPVGEDDDLVVDRNNEGKKSEDILDNKRSGEVDEENTKGEEVETGKTDVENIQKSEEDRAIEKEEGNINGNKEDNTKEK
jgi:hypothetical protein